MENLEEKVVGDKECDFQLDLNLALESFSVLLLLLSFFSN